MLCLVYCFTIIIIIVLSCSCDRRKEEIIYSRIVSMLHACFSFPLHLYSIRVFIALLVPA